MSQVQIGNLDYLEEELATNCQGCGYSIPNISIAYGAKTDIAYGAINFYSLGRLGGIAGGAAAASVAAGTGAAVSIGGVAKVLVSTFAASTPSGF